jgi:hypothetical protein
MHTIDTALTRNAILRDRVTGNDRDVRVVPHHNGQCEVWSFPKTIFINVRDKDTGKMITVPKRIHPRRLHWCGEHQVVWNPRLGRFEVRL